MNGAKPKKKVKDVAPKVSHPTGQVAPGLAPGYVKGKSMRRR